MIVLQLLGASGNDRIRSQARSEAAQNEMSEMARGKVLVLHEVLDALQRPFGLSVRVLQSDSLSVVTIYCV